MTKPRGWKFKSPWRKARRIRIRQIGSRDSWYMSLFGAMYLGRTGPWYKHDEPFNKRDRSRRRERQEKQRQRDEAYREAVAPVSCETTYRNFMEARDRATGEARC